MAKKMTNIYNGYKPPFTLPAKAVGLVADIAAQMERFAIRMEQSDAIRLRRVNRIKTIHSSLAIEGNKLLESEVADILDGKTVVAPIREIQEVKNAIKVYEEFEKLNPFSIDDLLHAHELMMAALTDDAGHFRKGGVGVFSGTGMVHLAPPAERVRDLMGDLFAWLKNDNHLLVRGCVFHYEFEFIHPFNDGNGRMGRLWQSLILSCWNPSFAHLPVENMVYANQQAYYDAIAQSTKQGDCGPFIDFMLGEIQRAVIRHKGAPLYVPANVGVSVGANVGVNELKILNIIAGNDHVTAKQMSEIIGISQRQVERLLSSLTKKQIIERVGADKNGYWRILER